MFNKVSKLDKPLPDIAAQVHSQKRHRLYASCGFYRSDAICQQVVSSLLTLSSCIKSVNNEYQTCCNLIFADLLTTSFPGILSALLDLLQVDETTCIKRACSSQLAASLLTTCNRLVIIKPEQAMRTHPDIATCAFLVVQGSHEVKQGFSAN